MYDIFVSFLDHPDLTQLDPNILAILACTLGLFVFHEVLSIICSAFRRMMGYRD